ncbi:MAG: hypothetical protein JWP69_1490 [Flaviaesturariibacter sp.]|nr:hypothetical protein [Flaviaesturariibacter sp.]
MKKLLGFAITALVFAACSDAGDERPEDMKTVMQSEPPTSDPNGGNAGPYDTSTRGVQDTSTVIDYDTAARKRQ